MHIRGAARDNPAGVNARWQTGYTGTRRTLDEACWRNAVDAIDGVIVHEIQGAA